MVLRGLPPYICFWEGCSLIYVSLEGLSGKKKAIEAQLYPKGEVVTGYTPCRGMDTFWPLKHNCTQIRGEQTTDQGDELYSFFGHSSIIVPYLASSMAFASLSFYHPYAGAILISFVSFQFQLLNIFNKSRSSPGRPWIEQTNKGKSNHWSTIVPYWTFGHHMDTSVGQHWTTLWKTLHPIKQVKT